MKDEQVYEFDDFIKLLKEMGVRMTKDSYCRYRILFAKNSNKYTRNAWAAYVDFYGYIDIKIGRKSIAVRNELTLENAKFLKRIQDEERAKGNN